MNSPLPMRGVFLISGLRHFICADIIRLNALARPVLAAAATLGFASAAPDSCKGTFQRGGRSGVFPVFSRKIIVGQAQVAVFGPFPDRLVVAHAAGCDADINSDP